MAFKIGNCETCDRYRLDENKATHFFSLRDKKDGMTSTSKKRERERGREKEREIERGKERESRKRGIEGNSFFEEPASN